MNANTDIRHKISGFAGRTTADSYILRSSFKSGEFVEVRWGGGLVEIVNVNFLVIV